MEEGCSAKMANHLNSSDGNKTKQKHVDFGGLHMYITLHYIHTFLYFLITILTNWTCPQVAS